MSAKPASPSKSLKDFSHARIALGHSGGALKTQSWLDFKLAHAEARDAVHAEGGFERFESEVASKGYSVLCIESRAHSKREYLLRPDLGRSLSEESVEVLRNVDVNKLDVAFIVSDGLSGSALTHTALPVSLLLLEQFKLMKLTVSPVVLLRYGRVAAQDQIGQLLRAKVALMLVGERPGLGTPNSVGAYFVLDPKIGKTDADRNCISNIHDDGLSNGAAANKICYLVGQALQQDKSGVGLKDDSESGAHDYLHSKGSV